MLYFIIISTALVFSTCYKPLHFYGTNKRSADTTDMHQWVKLKGCWSVFAWLLHRNRRCALCLYNPIKLGRVLGGVWCDNYNWCHQQIRKKNLQVCRFSDGVSRWKFLSHLIYINLFQKKDLWQRSSLKRHSLCREVCMCMCKFVRCSPASAERGEADF